MHAIEAIEKMYEKSMDELHGAKKYAKMAMGWKPTNAVYAKMYADMSNDEMKHATMLRDAAAKEAEKYKADESGELLRDIGSLYRRTSNTMTVELVTLGDSTKHHIWIINEVLV